MVKHTQRIRVSLYAMLGVLQHCSAPQTTSHPTNTRHSLIDAALDDHPTSETTTNTTIDSGDSLATVTDSNPTVTSVQESEIVVNPQSVGFAVTRGVLHRRNTATCSVVNTMPSCRGDEDSLACRTDGDCTEHPHGKCVSHRGAPPIGTTNCSCVYTCQNDSECGNDEACLCAEAGVLNISRCVPALCHTDADCPSRQCSVSVGRCGGSAVLACHTRSDQCQTSSQCNSGSRNGSCVWDETRWRCDYATCIRGRPIFLNGSMLTAQHRLRNDWLTRREGDY